MFCYMSNQSVIPIATEMKWPFYRLTEAIQKSNFSEEISKLQKSLILQSNIQRLSPSFIRSLRQGERVHY